MTPARAKNRRGIGLVSAIALAGSIALATNSATAAPAAGGDDAESISAGSQPSLARHVPQGELDLTRAQAARLDAKAQRTLASSRPGGVRIAPDTIVWEDEGAVLTFSVGGETRDAAPASQRDGRVRLYDGWYMGDRLTFVKCKFQKLRWYDFTNKVSSWSNKQYGNTWSRLYYWSGVRVAPLSSLGPMRAERFKATDREDDRADFIRVCG